MHKRIISDGFAAFIAMTVGNVIVHALFLFVRFRPDGNRGAVLTVVVHALFFAVTAILTPVIFRVFARSGAAGGRRRNWREVAVMAGTLLAMSLGFAARLPGGDAWVANDFLRFASIAGFAVCYSFALSLYFILMSPARIGLYYGISTAVAVAFRALSESLLDDLDSGSAFFIFYDLVLALLFLLFATLVVCLFRIGRIADAGSRIAALPALRRGDGGEYGGIILRLVAATVLFFFLNGLLAGRLYPFLDPDIDRQFAPLPLLLMAVSPLVGWLLDREGDLGVRRIIPLCALVFMLVPSLVVLGDSPLVYRAVHSLAVVGHFSFYITICVVLARLPGGVRGSSVLICIPHFFRLVCFPLTAWFRNRPIPDGGLVVLLCLIAAIAFYHLVRQVCDGLGGRKAADSGEPPVVAETAGSDPLLLFQEHHLTARESEIAALLLRGMSTAAMAENLHITESTVKVHVKNILRKFGIGTRRAFVAQFITGVADRKGE